MKHIARAIVAAGLLTVCWAAARAGEGVVVPFEGPRFSARLVEVDALGNFTFRAGDELRRLAVSDLVRFGAPLDPQGKARLRPTHAAAIVLADGGLLVADVLSCNGDELALGSALLGELRLPLDRVSGIVFRPPTDSIRLDRLLHQVRTVGGDNDRLILENGDELSGTTKGLPPSGTAPPQIEFDAGAGAVKIDVARIAAVVFHPTLVRVPRLRSPRVIVGLSDGSRLVAAKLAVAGDALQLESLWGQQFNASAEQIVSLQPLGEHVTYLSDLSPSDYKHVPFLTLTWPLERDRNVLGSSLRSSGQMYLKGLGMHSAARATFDLDRPYRKLQADLAIDDRAGSRGSVIFRVLVDGQVAYRSEEIRGGTPPVPVSVDISSARRLSLIVEYGQWGDQLDYANWLDARLVK
jgi:hypothetical protein